jgi:hypothetical protein
MLRYPMSIMGKLMASFAVVAGLTLTACGEEQPPQPASDEYERGRAQAEADAAYRAGYDSLAQERAAAEAIAEAEAAAAEAEWKECRARAGDAGDQAAGTVREAHAAELNALYEAIDDAFEAPVDTFDEQAVAAHDAGVAAAIERRNEASAKMEAAASAAAEAEAEAAAAANGCPFD